MGAYLKACQAAGIKPHPARFPPALPRFFVQFLTSPGDLVLDPFAGSNTTGAICEQEAGAGWLVSCAKTIWRAVGQVSAGCRTPAEELVAGEEHLGLPLFRK